MFSSCCLPGSCCRCCACKGRGEALEGMTPGSRGRKVASVVVILLLQLLMMPLAVSTTVMAGSVLTFAIVAAAITSAPPVAGAGTGTTASGPTCP